MTQWLTYSLVAPLAHIMKIRFAGTEFLTGLSEYRNGGLFVDTGVLVLREGDAHRGSERFREEGRRGLGGNVEVVPLFDVGDQVVVEWRGVTVGLLDHLTEDVNNALGLEGMDRLGVGEVMEAGSWKVSVDAFLSFRVVILPVSW